MVLPDNQKDLTLLGYIYHDNKFPEEKRYEMTGDGKKFGTLEVTGLAPRDSATYFCAASEPQCGRLVISISKTFSPVRIHTSFPHYCTRTGTK